MTEGIHKREYYLALVYRKLGMHDQLKQRWERIGYKPKEIQLKLF